MSAATSFLAIIERQSREITWMRRRLLVGLVLACGLMVTHVVGGSAWLPLWAARACGVAIVLDALLSLLSDDSRGLGRWWARRTQRREATP